MKMTKESNTSEKKHTQDGSEQTEDGSKEKSLQHQEEHGQRPIDAKEEHDLDKLRKDTLHKKISELIFNSTPIEYPDFKKELAPLLRAYVKKYFSEELTNKYTITFLCTQQSLSGYHLGKIYRHLKKSGKKSKDILLIINNQGGAIEPAFQISKICNQYKKGKFVVAIPGQAKSAATLLSLGANEIHMGDLGQLGPIDPQLRNGFPVLGVHDALIELATIVTNYPKSVRLFSTFIEKNVTLDVLGWLTRISQSASQYAQKLLALNYEKEDQIRVAKALVEDYKHHGFVIDAEEAKSIFGDKISEKLIKTDTPEIKEAESFFEELCDLEFLVNIKWAKPDRKTRIKINLVGDGSNCSIDEVQE